MPPPHTSSSLMKRQDDVSNNNANNGHDSKPQFYANISSADSVSRRHFIKKVYLILFVQLCVTAAIGYGLFVGLNENQKFKDTYALPLLIVCAVGVVCCMCTLMCCADVVRPFPRNYVFLVLFTLFMGGLTGFTSARFDAKEIGIAVGITAALFLFLTLFAVFVKKDFTGWGLYLMAALFILFLFGIVVFVFGLFSDDDGTFRILRIILSVCGTIIFSFYIIYDTQQIVGGENRKYTYSTDDYVFAAISLYLDIVNLFSCLLQLVGLS